MSLVNESLVAFSRTGSELHQMQTGTHARYPQAWPSMVRLCMASPGVARPDQGGPALARHGQTWFRQTWPGLVRSLAGPGLVKVGHAKARQALPYRGLSIPSQSWHCQAWPGLVKLGGHPRGGHVRNCYKLPCGQKNHPPPLQCCCNDPSHHLRPQCRCNASFRHLSLAPVLHHPRELVKLIMRDPRYEWEGVHNQNKYTHVYIYIYVYVWTEKPFKRPRAHGLYICPDVLDCDGLCPL